MAKKVKRTTIIAISNDLEHIENIRHCAYGLHEIRGREEGHDITDWLQAEAEMKVLETSTTKAE